MAMLQLISVHYDDGRGIYITRAIICGIYAPFWPLSERYEPEV